MAKDHDVIKYTLTREKVENLDDVSDLYLALHHARINNQQFLDGDRPAPSHIEGDPVTRAKKYRENTLTAMMGELVLNQFHHGKEKGMTEFNKSRKAHNDNPSRGDDGSDIPGFPVDAKTSYLRGESQECMGKTLSVRREERYAKNLYVLEIIKKVDIIVLNGIEKLPIHDTVDKWHIVHVYLVGWAYNEEFPPPDQPNGENWFEDSCVRYSYQLRPMSTYPYPAVGLNQIRGEGVLTI